jgi:biofilm PGA synthesis N-glycosyltransferase PgaC
MSKTLLINRKINMPKKNTKRNIVPYVLVSVAYNEERQIEQIIKCVVKQTILPKQWLIISDGSTDRTDSIVKRYGAKYPWIKYARLEKTNDPYQKVQKASYAYARSMAFARKLLANVKYDFIGNLDADMTFETSYFEKVLEKALADKKLGITGGGAYSVLENGNVVPGGFIQPDFVGGPLQFFRRKCLDDINGYFPYGHADVVAVFMARMKGWKVRCFPEIKAFHHGQPENTIRIKVPICFRLGQIDYIMEGYPPFIIGRCILRMFEKPVFIAGLSMLAGYLWATIIRTKRHLPKDLVAFMKKDQKHKLLNYFRLRPESSTRA